MKLIKGNYFTDKRGSVRFVNEYNMQKVVRMYCIHPKYGEVRAWQGHKKETKWFYVVKGTIQVKLLDMTTLKKNEFILSDKQNAILEIEGGYYNGFQALNDETILMVFSDFNLESSKADDFRLSLDVIEW